MYIYICINYWHYDQGQGPYQTWLRIFATESQNVSQNQDTGAQLTVGHKLDLKMRGIKNPIWPKYKISPTDWDVHGT